METPSALQRRHIHIWGAVQGVGFRPFVYRLAVEMGLTGWVINGAQGVQIEVEGAPAELDQFIFRVQHEKPVHALIRRIETHVLQPAGFPSFEIRHSDDGGQRTALVMPDLAICPECLREIFDLTNRRYRYPFTNCTNCGPRYSIIEALPYDRPHTTMRFFPMCEQCRAEYENPADRRFHAQPNACPDCGPHLELWGTGGTVFATHNAALGQTAQLLRAGKIVAIKGLGGFHLMVDARQLDAVAQLRFRKKRPAKPFALMFPSLAAINAVCHLSPPEKTLLTSSAAPIVLLQRRAESDEIPQNIAPSTQTLGVMLPYTPLHHLLMAELGFPVVATSGNLSDEPICTDNQEALDRLSSIADALLVHNRPIARPVDDSVVQIMAGQPVLLRRARGYAPLPIIIENLPTRILAVGAHQKNTIAAAVNENAFVSQHIGDLETSAALEAFSATIESFQHLYEFTPEVIACDLHPDYSSSHYADRRKVPVVRVQHHYAHALACMAEQQVEPPALAIVWDGTGYGVDGTIWGGEFLVIDTDGFQRAGHLYPFRLPGGEQAVKEPRRSALSLLYETIGEAAFESEIVAMLFSRQEQVILHQMMTKGLHSPITTSAGRLFDGVAALVGLSARVSFEGQAALELEALVEAPISIAYPFEMIEDAQKGTFVIDWKPLIKGILEESVSIDAVSQIAAKFHNTLVEMIVAGARRLPYQKVMLTGGCFQNKYLTEQTVQALQNAGFQPYWHQHIPPNDGGIALGQVMAAVRRNKHVSGGAG